VKTFDFPPQSTNEVKCCGEILYPILWQGRQWAVTDYGLECRDGLYAVDARDFWELLDLSSEANVDAQKVYLSWWRHLSGKVWCDKSDVDNAIRVMLILFDKHGNRTSVPAPRLMNEWDAENYALEAGNRAYQEAKRRALEGRA